MWDLIYDGPYQKKKKKRLNMIEGTHVEVVQFPNCQVNCDVYADG